jgi:hypothetical protein
VEIETHDNLPRWNLVGDGSWLPTANLHISGLVLDGGLVQRNVRSNVEIV